MNVSMTADSPSASEAPSYAPYPAPSPAATCRVVASPLDLLVGRAGVCAAVSGWQQGSAADGGDATSTTIVSIVNQCSAAAQPPQLLHVSARRGQGGSSISATAALRVEPSRSATADAARSARASNLDLIFDAVRAIVAGVGSGVPLDPTTQTRLSAAGRNPPGPNEWPADIPPATGYACLGRLDLAAAHAEGGGALIWGPSHSGDPSPLRTRALRAVLAPPPKGVGLGCLTAQGVTGTPLGDVGRAAMAATAIINASVGTPDLSAGAPPGDDTDGLSSLHALAGGLRFGRDRRLGWVVGALRASRLRRIYAAGGGASDTAQVSA